MQQLERAMAIYEEWVAAGRQVAAGDLVAAYPEVADLLRALLADREEVERSVVAAQAEPERVLGDFVLQGEIGRGGMGVVYRARQRSLDRVVALKVLPSHVTLQPSAVARFKREATLAARLEHPGIVAVHAVGTDGDAHWFAMELVDGRPLSRLDPKTGAARSVRQCVEICAQVCDALAHAHAQGVLHRDVKPSNILLRTDGRPVLTDFGLARDAAEPGITRTGAFAGTPHYSSPEQAASSNAVDARTDVWSLGVTLYELLTGRRPFDAASTAEVFAKITRAEPPDPLQLVPDLAPDLAAILGKALEKSPDRRYASATAFGDDLRAFLEFRPIAARRAGPFVRLQRWVRREPLRAALAAMLVVGVPALGVLAGYLLANRTAIEVGAEAIRKREREERLARLTIDLEAGDYDAAQRSGDRAIAEQPDDIEAHVLRALVGVYAGRDEQALAELDEAIAARHLPHAERARVAVLVAMGQTEQAAALEAAAPPATAPEALFLAAKAGLLRAAGRLIEPAVVRTIVDTQMRAILVSPAPRLHYYLQWSSALAWLGDAAAAARCSAVLMQLWPDSPAAQLYVAFALKASEPARAAELYHRVIAAGYDHPRLFTTLAECLQNAGDAAGARAARLDGIARYEQREREGRLGDSDLTNMVIQLQNCGRLDDAVQRARALVQRRPEFARGHRILGWLLAEAGDRQGAIAEFETSIRLDPDNGDAWRRLAEVRLAAGDQTGAIRDYGHLVELLPKSPLAHSSLAGALFQHGDFAAAAASLRRAIELQPDMPSLHSDLGVALRRQRDLAGAVAEFRTALEQKPDYGTTRMLLGAVLLEYGQRDEGLAVLRQFVATEPCPAGVVELLEVADAAAGQGSEGVPVARLALQRALERGPTDEQRATIRQKLDALDAGH
ncbi:MAG: protein kinase [Planctomycetota bacterium]